MKWNNLKENRCPQCNKTFKTFTPKLIKCSCNFIISVKRFNEIVNEQLNRQSKYQEIEHNQDELNNL